MDKHAKAQVAHIRQTAQFTCCAASITSALAALGKPYTEGDVNKILGAAPMQGATWEAMLATVQYFGCRGQLVIPSTPRMLKDWTDKGYPVLIGWNPEGRPWSHASVVFDVTEREDGVLMVHVMDPNIPNPSRTTRVLDEDEFCRRWYEKVSDSLIVRRPACVVTLEVDTSGRQMIASTKEVVAMKREQETVHTAATVRVGDAVDTKAGKKDDKKIVIKPEDLPKRRSQEALDALNQSGAGKHKNKQDYERGHARRPKHKKPIEREASELVMAWNSLDRAFEAKFPRGVPMTVEEVAAVVGDEFREMNENPPESVVKVREEMMGKEAGLDEDPSVNLAQRRLKMIDPQKVSKYRGRLLQLINVIDRLGVRDMTPDFIQDELQIMDSTTMAMLNQVARWPSTGVGTSIVQRMKNYRKMRNQNISFVDEATPLMEDMDAALRYIEDVYEIQEKIAHPKSLMSWRHASEIAFRQLVAAYDELDHAAKFEEGKPADPTENMSEEDAEEWRKQNLFNRDNFKEASAEDDAKKFLAHKGVMLWTQSKKKIDAITMLLWKLADGDKDEDPADSGIVDDLKDLVDVFQQAARLIPKRTSLVDDYERADSNLRIADRLLNKREVTWEDSIDAIEALKHVARAISDLKEVLDSQIKRAAKAWKAPPGKLIVVLKSVPNRDFRDPDSQGEYIEPFAEVIRDINEAPKAVRNFINEYDVGGGSFGEDAPVYDDQGKVVARIGYNGRIF